MTKKAELEINYCNSRCPHFYHKFSDSENVWCSRLNIKICDSDDQDMMFDFSRRPIPKECPLEDI